MGINYGADRLRFGSGAGRLARARKRGLLEVEKQKDGSFQAKIRVTVEIEGSERPGCVIDTNSRYYPAEKKGA
jgi:hypothetical protein